MASTEHVRELADIDLRRGAVFIFVQTKNMLEGDDFREELEAIEEYVPGHVDGRADLT